MCLFSNSTRVSSPEALYWVCVANDFSCSMKQIDSRVWSREVEMQSCQFCHSKWGKSISNMQSAMGYLQSHSSPKDHRHTTRQARPQPQESDTPHTAEDPQASATQEVMSSKSKAADSITSGDQNPTTDSPAHTAKQDNFKTDWAPTPLKSPSCFSTTDSPSIHSSHG
jgi:hypothetical protein